MTYYRAVVTVGDTTWDVTSAAAPTYGPRLPLSFGWRVPEDSLGFPVQPEPSTASLGLILPDAAALAGVDIGTPVHLEVYLDQVGGAVFATWEGRVAEMTARPHRLGLEVSLQCVDYSADLAAVMVGAGPWPAESATARVDRILLEAGWSATAASVQGGTLEARDGDPVSALEALTEVMRHATIGGGDPMRNVFKVETSGGVIDPARTIRVRWARDQIDYMDWIPAGVVSYTAEWTRTRRNSADQVTITHQGVATTYGDPAGVPHPPVESPLVDPAPLAEWILRSADDGTGHRWDTESMRLELWATAQDRPDPAAETVARYWMDRENASLLWPGIGRMVVVEDVPATHTPDGSTKVAGMLAGAEFTIPADARPVIDFTLSSVIPWGTVPAGQTVQIDQLTGSIDSQALTFNDLALVRNPTP